MLEPGDHEDSYPDFYLAGASWQDANREVDAPTSERRAWTREEDAIIARLVAQHGTRSWPTIAANLYNRTGKQCRERCSPARC